MRLSLQLFDKGLCLRQLRYSGMMETAKIRKAGFAVRYKFKDFVDRYWILVKDFPAKRNIHINSRDVTQMICKYYHTVDEYQLGRNKVFLKDDVTLELQRDRIILAHVVKIQRWYRRQMARRTHEKRVRAAIVIQKHWRGREPRKRYLLMTHGLLRLQAVIRSRQLAVRFEKLRRSIAGFQAHCRGYFTRKGLHHRVTNDSKMLIELTIIRRQEEQQLKRAGHKNYKELAEVKYRERVAAMQRARIEAREKPPPALKPKPEKRLAPQPPPRKPEISTRPHSMIHQKNEINEQKKIQRSASIESTKPRSGSRNGKIMKSIQETDVNGNTQPMSLKVVSDYRNGKNENDFGNNRNQQSHIVEKPKSYKEIDAEEGVRVIENEFEFLNDPQPVNQSTPRKKKTVTVSRMKNFFEEQSRIVKKIPTKLLSRPVNYYDSSRL